MTDPAASTPTTASSNPERRFFAVVLAIGLAVLAAYVAGFALVWKYGAERLDPGWTAEFQAERGWVVATVATETADAITPGDLVVAIDRKPVARSFPYVPLRAVPPGQTYTLLIERDGVEREITLPMRVESSRENLFHPWFYLGMGVVLFAIGIAIGLLRPDDRNARWLCFTWLALAMGLQSQGLFPMRDLYAGPEFAFFCVTQYVLFVAFCLGFTFYNQFPFGAPAQGVWTAIRYVLYSWATIVMLGLAGLQMFLVRADPTARIFGLDHRSFASVYIPFYGFFIITVLFGMCAAVINGFRRATEPDQRRRIRWVVYGSLAGILPFATSSLFASNSAPGATSFTEYGFWHWFSVAMILSIPFTVSYAVVKHRLFDIRVVIRHGLQYLLAANALRGLVLVQIVAFTAVLFANSTRTVGEIFLQNSLPLGLLALTVASLWVHHPLKEWLDRRFFREAYDRERVLGELAESIKSLPYEDDIAERVGQTIAATLHPRSIAIFYISRDRTHLTAAKAFEPRVPPPDDAELVKALETRGDAFDVRGAARTGIPEPILTWLARIPANLVVPMLGTERRFAGVIVLGERLSEQPYTTSDRDLLLAICREMAFADETVRLRESERRERDANRAKSVFLANMSHELRTPLNAILGFAQLMERTTELTDTHREYLATITRSGEHLLGLINDVLSISKIEAGKVTLNSRAFDVHYLLKGIEEMFQLRAGDKGLNLLFSIDPDLPRFVEADEGKMRQVLINLLGNAVKFTDQGGVALRCRWDAQAGVVEFEVEDTGPGIASDERDDVFEPFGQTTSGRTSWEGTGLGLAICRTFVEVMGGEIDFSSQVGLGTTFRFHLPIVVSDSTIATPDRRRVRGVAPGQRAFRLLVVDDKAENRTLLATLLKSVGFDTRDAVNGKQAVDEWEAWRPDVIWMDMRMPVMDGLEATRLIRTREEAAVKAGRVHRTRIVALTASAFEHDREAILAAGCDDFVAKPYREATIFEKLTEHLGITFVFDEPAPGEESVGVDAEGVPERIASIPVPLRESLTRAIDAGDLDAAGAIIDSISGLDPTIAGHFRALLRSYQLDEMQQELADCEPNTP